MPPEVQRPIQYNAPTPELSDAEQAKKHIAFYCANLAQINDCLGRVAQAVHDLGLENDAILCYTSDHGEMPGNLGL